MSVTLAECRQAIGEILVEKGLITAEQLESALVEQRRTGARLGEVLVGQGLIDRMAIASALARQWSARRSRVAELEVSTPPLPAELEAAEHVTALLAQIDELERTMAQLRETLARRDEQLELLTEIITGQAVAEEPVEEAPEAEHAVTAPWAEVIPRAGETWTGAPPRLGDLLVAKGFITNEQLGEALVESRETGDRLGRVLLRKGLIFEPELARTLSEQWHLPYLNLSSIGVDRGTVRLLPVEVGLRFSAIPVRHLDDGVQVAFADPSDQAGLAAVREHIPSTVPGVAELTDIETAWRRLSSGR